MYQNYSNLFNPSTKISWQTLKIYDVLGNEVATLVNEYKPTRKYEVEFNAAHACTCGESFRAITNVVYFYRLKAGDYIEIKKMIH